jgi:hypothetical protein
MVTMLVTTREHDYPKMIDEIGIAIRGEDLTTTITTAPIVK